MGLQYARQEVGWHKCGSNMRDKKQSAQVWSQYIRQKVVGTSVVAVCETGSKELENLEYHLVY